MRAAADGVRGVLVLSMPRRMRLRRRACQGLRRRRQFIDIA
jgi:hypothetical protein